MPSASAASLRVSARRGTGAMLSSLPTFAGSSVSGGRGCSTSNSGGTPGRKTSHPNTPLRRFPPLGFPHRPTRPSIPRRASRPLIGRQRPDRDPGYRRAAEIAAAVFDLHDQPSVIGRVDAVARHRVSAMAVRVKCSDRSEVAATPRAMVLAVDPTYANWARAARRNGPVPVSQILDCAALRRVFCRGSRRALRLRRLSRSTHPFRLPT